MGFRPRTTALLTRYSHPQPSLFCMVTTIANKPAVLGVQMSEAMHGDGFATVIAQAARTDGDPAICIAILDGPVDCTHPCFCGAELEVVPTWVNADHKGAAARHGTHVASIIFGQPGSAVRGISPRCRGLVIPVYGDT